MTTFINALNGGIPRVFGNGLLGTAVTGIGRITALMPTMIATLMIGELALRGLQNTLQGIGLKPTNDSWIARAGKYVSDHGARPYKDADTKTLAKQAVAFAIIGIVGNETMRVLGGQIPPIYNNVLAFIGPVRLSTKSQWEGMADAWKAMKGIA